MAKKKSQQPSAPSLPEVVAASAAADLLRSGLSLDDFAAAGGVVVPDASQLLGHAPAVPALVFAYWEPWAKRFVPPAEFYRLKLLYPDALPGQFATAGAKYLQPAGSLNGVYLPKATAVGEVPWETALQDTSVPLVITEGEKKALAGCKAGFMTVGLGGVTMVSAEKKGIHELEFFDHVRWAGRPVHVVFDTDTATGLKPEVQKAANKLLALLARKGADAKLLTLPPPTGGGKVALDDYLVAHGAAGFHDLLTSAVPNQSARALLDLADQFTYVHSINRIHDSHTGQLLHEADFRLLKCNATIDRMARRVSKVGGTAVATWVLDVAKAGQAWLEWPGRPIVTREEYVPGGPPKTATYVNLWRGWEASKPTRGDPSPFFWALDNIFGDDPAAREFVDHWLFYPIKFPGAKLYTVCLVMSPMEGIGKTFPAEMLARYVYGVSREHSNAAIIQEGDIEGNFNDHLVTKQFVLSDDIAGDEAYKHLARIKSLITAEDLLLKRKFMPPTMIKNRMNLYLTSNMVVPFRLADDDRRFFVHSPRDATKDFDRYTRLRQWFENGGGNIVRWWAMERYDEKQFDPRTKAPDTRARAELIRFGRTDAEMWARDLVAQAHLLTRDFATIEELVGLAQLDGLGDRLSPMRLSKVLRMVGAIQWHDGQLVRLGKDKKAKRPWLLRAVTEWQQATADELQAEAEKKPEFKWQQGPLAVVEGGKEKEARRGKF